MNEKAMKFLVKMLYPVQTSRERCASNNISRDNQTLLLVATFYSPISSFWEGPLQNSVPLSTFLHIHTKASEKVHFSGGEGKYPVVLVM